MTQARKHHTTYQYVLDELETATLKDQEQDDEDDTLAHTLREPSEPTAPGERRHTDPGLSSGRRSPRRHQTANVRPNRCTQSISEVRAYNENRNRRRFSVRLVEHDSSINHDLPGKRESSEKILLRQPLWFRPRSAGTGPPEARSTGR